MIGGWDIQTKKESIISEILEKDINGTYNWRALKNTESFTSFLEVTVEITIHSENKWYYPRAFLTSTGNIFGISYIPNVEYGKK